MRTIDHDGVMMQSVAFHPNGRVLATAGGKDRALTLWDSQTGERIKTLAGKSFVFTQAAFISEGRQVLGACSDGQLRLLNVNQGGCAYRVVAHSKSINALAIRGRTIVTGGADRMAKIWMLQQSV